MPRKNLTARFVESVTAETRTDFWDDMIRGLVLRVSPTGIKTWCVVYTRESDGSRQRVTLGQFPAVALEKARAKALASLTDISNGGDPAAKKKIRREAMTVRDLGGAFIEQYAKREKKTWAEDQRILDVEVYPKIGSMKAMLIKRRDIMDIIDGKADAGRVGQSRKIMSMLRKLLNWAVEKDLLEVNPIAGVKAPGKPGRKDRFLKAAEIKSLWQALDTAALLDVTKDVLRLLLLTGQRSGEVCGMVRVEIDPDAACGPYRPAELKTAQRMSSIYPTSPWRSCAAPLTGPMRKRQRLYFPAFPRPSIRAALPTGLRMSSNFSNSLGLRMIFAGPLRLAWLRLGSSLT